MLVNPYDEVFVGRRVDTRSEAWQMPQGGVDEGETYEQAVMRELEEEAGTSKAKILGHTDTTYSYDLPSYLIPKLWNGQYRGQNQLWYLLRFMGKDNEININTAHPEFCAWRWAKLDELPHIIVPFKRKLYRTVIKELKPLLG